MRRSCGPKRTAVPPDHSLPAGPNRDLVLGDIDVLHRQPQALDLPPAAAAEQGGDLAIRAVQLGQDRPHQKSGGMRKTARYFLDGRVYIMRADGASGTNAAAGGVFFRNAVDRCLRRSLRPW